MLRKMPLELALDRLHGFLIAKQALGTEELIVVVGKGRGSPDGIPVLAPAVRDWLKEHSELVASFEEAPLREGGAGALLVRLRPLA
jgi:DNA-nicking Smr family endonuclease